MEVEIRSKEEVEKMDKVEAEVTKLSRMTIQSIDKYGCDTQERINFEMGNIISQYKTFDTGEIGDQLTELAIVANSTTSKLTKSAPMIKIQKLLGRFDTVENKMEQLTNGIEGTKNKLYRVMDSMLQSREYLKKYIANFADTEKALEVYLEKLELETDCDEIRRQAVINRLKSLTTSRVTAEQSFVETTLLIGQTKEVQHQIDEMLTNIVPIFRMKLVNALCIKAHKEALELKEQVTRVSEKLIIENAKNIEKNTDIMLENRRTSVIKADTLIEANEILQRVVQKAIDSCATESEANKEVIRRLNEASRTLTSSEQALSDEENKQGLVE